MSKQIFADSLRSKTKEVYEKHPQQMLYISVKF